MTDHDMQLTWHEATDEDRAPLGLHQEWITGNDGPGFTFELTCGAGLGSPLLNLWVTQKGRRVHYWADISIGLTDLLTRLDTRKKGGK